MVTWYRRLWFATAGIVSLAKFHVGALGRRGVLGAVEGRVPPHLAHHALGVEGVCVGLCRHLVARVARDQGPLPNVPRCRSLPILIICWMGGIFGFLWRAV